METMEDIKLNNQQTNCAEQTHFVSTYAHLDWITAAKTQIQAGSHSFQKDLTMS